MRVERDKDVDSSMAKQARQLTPHCGVVAHLGNRVVGAGGSHSHGEDTRGKGHTDRTSIDIWESLFFAEKATPSIVLKARKWLLGHNWGCML